MPVECISSCTMPTNHGRMAVRVYGERDRGEAFYSQHAWVACLWADCDDVYRGSERVHMRVHDACLTSEVLGSLKCDCAVQLRLAQQHLAQQGGILIYTPQEGRGIGLASKIAAYGLQERQGLDTVDANLALGLPDEARDYTPVRTILDSLGVRSVVLLTNNPFKVHALRSLGIDVAGRRAVLASSTPAHAHGYLETKARRMGHILTPEAERPGPLGASGPRLLLSGRESMTLTHGLRAVHEAIMVGSGTLLADDPQLTVRLLRLQLGVRSVMIEGGAALIASCLQKELAHRLIVTIAPKTLINGLRPAAAGPWPSASSSPATEGAVVDVGLRRLTKSIKL
eukprot:jgi/Chrpa1/25172/Chrysochromulina_OHIO_Genome00010096-RA